MTLCIRTANGEPWIAVGLVQKATSIPFKLAGSFVDGSGLKLPPGEYQAESRGAGLALLGVDKALPRELSLAPVDGESGRFALEATIGIDFHWQQREEQTFCGRLRLSAQPDGTLSVINDVPLESYILSVICSEMNAASPAELAKAHAIISRSWLLAQLDPPAGSMSDRGHAVSLPQESAGQPGEISRFYDRAAHTGFDVCADDHCQRYQGTARIRTGTVHDAIGATRGMVMAHAGRVCDSRFSKCCGGVTEDFRVAWSDTAVPYLVPLFDGVGALPSPALSDETAFRRFLSGKHGKVYCDCHDERILSQVLNSYDRKTNDFFRWQVRLEAGEAGDLLRQKTGLDLGRIRAMEPVERGLSGRLKRLRFVGEKGTMVIGKELEIRKALSPSHLYSSAFVIDVEGFPSSPHAFILTGGGWGHGVGLCQIGAAVMAWQGVPYAQILSHYYPGAEITRLYD